MILDIFDTITKYKIILKTSWVPRTLASLRQVDNLSRFSEIEERSFDRDGWGISDDDLAFIWSRFEDEYRLDQSDWLDVFADSCSARFKNYFSPIQDASSFGTDAFNFSWKKYKCYICPPIRLIPAAIRHAEANKATGILVIPKWVSRSFWNLICEDGIHLNRLFKRGLYEYYPSMNNFGDVKSPLFKGKSAFPWLILWFRPVDNAFVSNVTKYTCTESGYNKCNN